MHLGELIKIIYIFKYYILNAVLLNLIFESWKKKLKKKTIF